MIEKLNIIPDRCVHSHAFEANCKLCVEVCPKNAWEYDEEGLGIEWDLCDGCNLCVAVCPQRAIERLKPIQIKHYINGAGVLPLACEFSEIEDGFKNTPCIHSFGIYDLIDLYKEGVRLIIATTGDCDSCPRNKISIEHLIENFNKLLSEEGLPPIAFKKMNPAEFKEYHKNFDNWENTYQTSRRGFLKTLVKKSVEAGVKFVEPEEEFKPPVFALFEDKQEGLFPYIPEINEEKCIGCDICANLCPTKAISIGKKERRLYYFINPSLCTGCNICIDACQFDAVKVKNWENSQFKEIPLKIKKCSRCKNLHHIPAGNTENICLKCKLGITSFKDT